MTARRSAPGRARSDRRTLAVVVGTTVSTGLPIFLLSTLFVQVAEDTAAPVSALGVIVAAFWTAAAIVSPTAGPLAVRLGSWRLAALAVLLATVSLTGIATASPSWYWLVGWAVVGGAANALGHPASNQVVALGVDARRQAFAYGLKQGAVPLTSIAGGIAVPLVALTVGWRWAFVAAGALSLFVLASYVRSRSSPAVVDDSGEKGGRLGRQELRRLAVVACSCLFAAGAATTIVSFGVTGAVHRGLDPGLSGLLMSLASAIAGAMRVGVGLLADRGIGGSFRTIAAIQAVGAVGVLAMAWPATWTYAVGLLLAVGFGWGWPGLMHYAVSTAAGPAAAAATGIVSIGNYVGNAGLPLVFGLLFGRVPESVPWLIAGVALAAAALMVLRLGGPRAPQPEEGRAVS